MKKNDMKRIYNDILSYTLLEEEDSYDVMFEYNKNKAATQLVNNIGQTKEDFLLIAETALNIYTQSSVPVLMEVLASLNNKEVLNLDLVKAVNMIRTLNQLGLKFDIDKLVVEVDRDSIDKAYQ